MAEKKTWIVTTSGDRPLGDIKKKLDEAGFKVDQVLEHVGCITGEASDDAAARARSIPGVTDVSPDVPIDIGPPDSPVTW
ncbi:MAG TPA: hypothetical protein VD861_11630 [Pyrinomonadaceae bacterium]|nr:hypothetical protein [Pyrinomonadaceae bacterium]